MLNYENLPISLSKFLKVETDISIIECIKRIKLESLDSNTSINYKELLIKKFNKG
jgi:hypothetical protein